MSGGHAHGLYVHARSPLHDAAPHCKVVAALAFVVAVVATPRAAVWAFAAHAVVVAAVARAGRVPAPFVARRLTLELPFVAFALLLPFVGGGPRVDVAGVALSVEGSWAAWTVVAKATLTTAAMIVLGATTTVADLLHGLERLRASRTAIAIAGFMVRYADVVTGEVRRMRIARAARCYDGRGPRAARASGATLATLFVRSFERGERVHVAMLSRGFSGVMPPAARERPPSRAQWGAALSVPTAALVVCALAWSVA